MRVSISPELSVRDGRSAIDFYIAAFGATVVYQVGGSDVEPSVVAQLSVGDSSFWVSDESPEHHHFSPRTLRGSTVRILLVADDPGAVAARAIALGATLVYPVTQEHGWLLGRVEDPYGHQWEIGKPLIPWPPEH